MSYRFKLERYRGKKRKCPKCKQQTFKCFVDVGTGQIVDADVGRCDREDNCGYQYSPREYFRDKKINYKPQPPIHVPYEKKEPVMLNYELIAKSQRTLDENLIRFLGLSRADCELWHVGTILLYGKRMVVFWQVDNEQRVHAGKIMGYDSNGKRCKTENNSIHRLLYGRKNVEQTKCFFGQHLTTPGAREEVNIVESEKTALWAWRKFGGLWLAAGSMTGINLYKIRMLKNKDVVLWPDTGKGLEVWREKMSMFYGGSYNVRIAKEVVEANGTVADGSDIMDYLK